jgi:hypothetical protein
MTNAGTVGIPAAASGRALETSSTSRAGVDKGSLLQSSKTPAPERTTPPPDFAGWLASISTHEAANVLGVGKGRVRQLRAGVGGKASQAILRRWEDYQLESGLRPPTWHVRRVCPDGVVYLAGWQYTVPADVAVPGQCVCVTAVAEGGLLAAPIDVGAGRYCKPVAEDETA